MSFRLLDLLPSFLPQTIDPDGHYSINGCSTATQKPNGPSRSHQSCGNLQPCSKIPLQDKNVYICFFFEKIIFLCAWAQDVAIETRSAFPDSSKFLQVFWNQNFCKFATALAPGGLPENKQMLISGIPFVFVPCFYYFPFPSHTH